MKLQASPDSIDTAAGSSTWIDIPSASWTAATVVNIELRSLKIRGVVSGGGGTESINLLLK